MRFIEDYRHDHDGTMPRQMSDLSYYAIGSFHYFYPPIPGYSKPLDWSINATAINAYSGYVLVRQPNTSISTAITHALPRGTVVMHKPNTSVFVCEKPGLWSDGTISIGLSNGTVERLSSEEFQKLNLRWPP